MEIDYKDVNAISITSVTCKFDRSGFWCISFRSGCLIGLTGIEDQRKLNRPQSASARSFLRVCHASSRERGKNAVQKMEAL